MTERNMPVLLEPDDLHRLPDGDRYELVDGIPLEKPMGTEADRIALRMGSLLDQFCLRARAGLVFGSQTGYQCFSDKPNQVRMPDASFVAPGKLAEEKTPEGYIKVAPDIAVEVVSPNELFEELEAKVKEYQSAGVKLVWVVSPRTHTVMIRRLDGTCAEVGITGPLSGEDVLPGFVCQVADLFV